MKYSPTISGLLLFILVFCTSNLNQTEINEYLNQLESEYEIICKQAGTEVWNYYSDTSINSMTEYKQSLTSFLFNDSINRDINFWYSRINEISNDTLHKRLILWKRILTCAQVDFNPDITELQNQLESQLSNYPSEGISDEELENSILTLINLRNNKAKHLGYSNYAYLVLQNTGIDTIWFEKLVKVIDSSTSESYNSFIRNNIPDAGETLEYGDIRKYVRQSFLISEDPVIDANKKNKIIQKTLSNIGINLSDYPIQFELTDLPPGIGGFGNCIDIPNDFRAVATKDLSFHNLLHEIGHGLHWTNVSTKHPVLKGYEWCTGNLSDTYSESMAETVAKFAQNKNWMMDNGFDEAYIDSIQLNRKRIGPVYMRLNLINSLFEIELYKHPEKDPAVIKNELYKRYLNADIDFSTRPNLIRLSYVSYPVYEQNYLIADIVSWQIHGYLKKEFGDNYAFNPKVGNFLSKNFWKDGELYDWQDRIKIATGEDLNIDGFLKDIQTH